ncbi:hypothetical protein JCM10207_002208 [Rhodosporidiobolus poonsookiae]
MQSSVGRPGPSYSSSSRGHQPYPQPGTAKPPALRGAAGQAGPRLDSARTYARAKWMRILGGPTFLEAGHSNRLVLSIRSGIPAEVDFGLERLVQVSSLDPDLLRFSELPGLLDGLLGLIRDYVERRQADKASGVPSLAHIVGEEPREPLRRRAAEAALILRNVVPGMGNVTAMLGSKRLKKMICEVLEDGAGEGEEAEETTELRLYLLDVLEIVADKIPLALPGHAITADAPAEGDDEDRPPPAPEPLDSPAVRLFPALVALTCSKDRALVLSAFRCLTVLSTNQKSDSVFALLTYEAVQPLPKPHPHPIQTAIELLPLGDAELNTAILDFIYQHTALPSNAVLFSTRPDLLSILRLVCTKFHIKAKFEEVAIDLRVAKSEAKQWSESLPKRHAIKPLPTDHEANSPLSREELASILYMPEPARVIQWMRLAFEPDANSDITQVSFWKAYETLFTPHMTPGVPVMLSASDVIQRASEGHPSATPVVLETPERRFVIKGIKQRERTDLRSRNRCRWARCSARDSFASPIACYHHIHDTHLTASHPPPSQCAWQSCSYACTTSDPLSELSLHVRTHLTSFTTPPTAPAELTDLPSILPHERHHAERDTTLPAGAPTAAGASLLAVLILRNLARVAKLAVDAKAAASGSATTSGGNSVASGNAAIGRLAGDEQSIFEAFAAAAEGLAKKDGVLSRLEKVDYAQAMPAVEALGALEGPLVKMVMSDVALGKVLGEVVLLVEYCRRKADKLGKEAPPVEVQMRGA